MKGNNGSGNIVERDNWETPQWLFDKLDNQYGFMWDCCAVHNNSKCPAYCEDFLQHDRIQSKCWMNPPFSKAVEMFKHFFDSVEKGVAIYRCDNLETGLWQNIIFKHASWVFIPKGRISYEGKAGKGSRFPSALIGLNVAPPKLDIEGATLILKKESIE